MWPPRPSRLTWPPSRNAWTRTGFLQPTSPRRLNRLIWRQHRSIPTRRLLPQTQRRPHCRLNRHPRSAGRRSNPCHSRPLTEFRPWRLPRLIPRVKQRTASCHPHGFPPRFSSLKHCLLTPLWPSSRSSWYGRRILSGSRPRQEPLASARWVIPGWHRSTANLLRRPPPRRHRLRRPVRHPDHPPVRRPVRLLKSVRLDSDGGRAS